MKKTFIKPFIKMAEVQGLHNVIATSGEDPDPEPAVVNLRFNSNRIWDNGSAD